MPEQFPEFVAAASLSPLSPAPVPIPTSAVSKLLGHAATAAAAAGNTATPPLVPCHPSAMASNTEPTEISDTIVVGGDYADESHDKSDDSIDYGEGEDGRGQEKIEPDAANDDYARTFDSPAAHEDQSEVDADQPDVSMASDSMNSPSAPDPLTSQSPTAAVPSDHPSPPPALALTTNTSAPDTSTPSEQAGLSETPSEAPSAAPNGSPSHAAPAEHTPAAPSPDAVPAAAAAVAAAAAPPPADEDDAAVDIQKLVDDITAKAVATASPSNSPAQASPSTTQAAPAPAPAPAPSTVSLPASLPPKPSLPLPPATLPAIPQPHHSFQSRGLNGSAHSALSMMNTAGSGAPRGNYMSAATHGAANEGISSLPPPPPAAFSGPSNNHAHAHHMPLGGDSTSIKPLWDQFQADEKRYTSEAKWERFPEGSRIFIGNLSSERVTKREVFDVFHQFGRLAQISLKNAYGFVQYHTIPEGTAAMQAAQGIELGGRRIHLEISRAQKKKDERERSPDRRTPRGGRGSDARFDAGDRTSWKRDDYRPGRSPSPRRNEGRGSRDGPFPRDREFGAGHERRRSRSPVRFNRYGEESSYRRRSPSPHRRAPSDGDRLDIPRRFGADVPDVQILLTQEVSRDFVAWVQGALHNRGLKTDVMYINPRFPRDAVVQRQVVEGVHAIIDLDYTAQSQGKIPVQVFIRSGASSVRFELYQQIDPPVAAELVLREKSQFQSAAHLDNNALQALLASLQKPQPGGHGHPGMGHQGIPPTHAPQAAQIDMNALLGNLRNAAAAQPVAAPSYGAAPAYAPPIAAAVPSAHHGFGGGDTAQQVQMIMDQLKRAAQ
ncbi:hypothetical protein BT67DRAFT_427421 [Trichocladium antarcticum]|uniref:RRM domain-containing protein n=1 Tax=Trichocladium antarcticum TaxID=1450529 RepID=A0AAN6UEA2_9PEZI|nr:hypothetical protein BT67DRAFT_427421 [Trichocladium antarcticum]